MIPGSANPLLLTSADSGYEIERSLRFNSADSAYLNRTPSAAGNQNTWTWSGWIKKHGVGTQSFIFGAAGYMQIYFSTDQILVDETPSGGSYWTMRSTAVLRDPSAWYHCVFVYDSTQATASNRFKVYVNNSEITSWVSDTRSNIVQNNGGRINSAAEHRICRQGAGNIYANVSLADVHFIDGQALAPTDFGETDNNNVWQPKKFAGTYFTGVNNATGAVPIYNTTDDFGLVKGTGYQNDSFAGTTNGTGLVLAIPGDVATDVHHNINTGSSQATVTNDGVAVITSNSRLYGSSLQFESANTDSLSVQNLDMALGTGDLCVEFWVYNKTNKNYSAFISTRDSNGTTAGFVIAGDAGGDLYVHSNAALAGNYSGDLTLPLNQWSHVAYTRASGTHRLFLNGVAASNSTTTSRNFTYGTLRIGDNPYGTGEPINAEMQDIRVYKGVAKYTSNFTVPARTSNGFHLDFKDNSSNAALGTDTSGNSNTWTVNNLNAGASTPIYSSGLSYVGFSGTTTFSGDGPGGVGAFDGSETTRLTGDTSSGNGQTAIYTWVPPGGSISASSFKLKFQYFGTNGFGTTSVSVNGGSYYTQGGSTSITTYDFSSLITGGQITEVKVKWVANQSGIGAHAWYAMYINNVLLVDADPTDSDSLVDTPSNGTQTDTGAGGEVVGNYATWNPLTIASATYKQGNLLIYSPSNDVYITTVAVSSGKYYVEILVEGAAGAIGLFKVDDPSGNITGELGWSDGGAGFRYDKDGTILTNQNITSYGDSYTSGDIIGIALDMDNGKVFFSKNGTFQNSGVPTSGANPAFSGLSGTFAFAVGSSLANADAYTLNAGQRSFNTAAPAGFLSLNTANLPEPTIADGSKYFDTKLYTGNGGTQSITMDNSALSPDFVWIKCRNDAFEHQLFDSVRGALKSLRSDNSSAEATVANSLTSFDSNGFSLGGSQPVNHTKNYAAWAWDAGSSNTTIAAGSLNSSAYNQSQTWSSLVSTPNTLRSGGGAFAYGALSTIFDGNLANGVGTDSGNLTLNFSSGISASNSTVEVYIYHTYSATITAGGNTYTTNTGASGTNEWVTVSGVSGTITQITVNGSGSVGTCGGIKIDGKILVDSGVTPPNVPTIASTVRANPSAGFSIVSYTGVTGNQSFGHGLNVKPKFILIKNRSNSADWFAMFDTGATHYQHGYLNGTSRFYSASAQSVTSSTITLGNNNSMFGANGDNYVAYCFAPVEGYSSMGSYVGNGSTDGPFVYTGFRPRWILGKATTTTFATGDWFIYDTERETFNSQSKPLGANTPNVEDSGGYYYIDVLSNGFKIRGQYDMTNKSSETYIWVALAEHPFASNGGLAR